MFYKNTTCGHLDQAVTANSQNADQKFRHGENTSLNCKQIFKWNYNIIFSVPNEEVKKM